MKYQSSAVFYLSLVSVVYGGVIGETCDGHEDCNTLRCIPSCSDSTVRVCDKHSDFYERIGFQAPLCIDDSDEYLQMDVEEEGFDESRKRLIGQKCISDQQCRSGMCTWMCNEAVKLCNKPEQFFSNQGLSVPRCIGSPKHIGENCYSHNQCQSGICTWMCGETARMCNKPEQFFTNQGLSIPKCYGNPKHIGQKCVSNDQCQSSRCIPFCNNSENRVCDKPDNFYAKSEVPPPICLEETFSAQPVAQEVESFENSRNHIGDLCETDDQCLSNRCTPLCDNEKRFCDKPEIFYMKKELEIPDCIDIGSIGDETLVQDEARISSYLRRKW